MGPEERVLERAWAQNGSPRHRHGDGTVGRRVLSGQGSTGPGRLPRVYQGRVYQGPYTRKSDKSDVMPLFAAFTQK